MESTVSIWIDSSWFQTVLAILFGGIVTAIFFFASQVSGKPVYQRRSLRLIGSSGSELRSSVEIRFKGDVVERLTKTDLIVWNAGRKTILGSQIVATDPIRFEFSPGSRILEISTKRVTRQVNSFAVLIDQKNPNYAIINFDYLDRGDGALIEVLHTDSKLYPECVGSLREIPNGIKDLGIIREIPMFSKIPYIRTRKRSFFYFVSVVGFSAIAFGVFAPTSLLSKINNIGPFGHNSILMRDRFPLILAGILYFPTSLYILWSTRQRFPKSLWKSD